VSRRGDRRCWQPLTELPWNSTWLIACIRCMQESWSYLEQVAIRFVQQISPAPCRCAAFLTPVYSWETIPKSSNVVSGVDHHTLERRESASFSPLSFAPLAPHSCQIPVFRERMGYGLRPHSVLQTQKRMKARYLCLHGRPQRSFIPVHSQVALVSLAASHSAVQSSWPISSCEG